MNITNDGVVLLNSPNAPFGKENRNGELISILSQPSCGRTPPNANPVAID
jgi:hypothetical protein